MYVEMPAGGMSVTGMNGTTTCRTTIRPPGATSRAAARSAAVAWVEKSCGTRTRPNGFMGPSLRPALRRIPVVGNLAAEGGHDRLQRREPRTRPAGNPRGGERRADRETRGFDAAR